MDIISMTKMIHEDLPAQKCTLNRDIKIGLI